MGLRWSKSTKASGSTESPLGRMMEPARKFISRKQEETIDADAAQDSTLMSVDEFELLCIVGKGSFGKVMQVRRKKTGKIYAMKVLKKNALVRRRQISHTKTERRVLARVEHPFITRLRFAFQSKHKLYIVLDFFNGGELFYWLKKEKKFSEVRAKFYAAQILLAIECLHQHNIVYRDLKPENLILDSDGFLKVADFGLSKESITAGNTTHTFCGTAEYLAPEVLKGKGYGQSVDWWSFGTLLYEMLTGLPPFYNQNIAIMYERILHAPVRFPANLSEDAKDLLSKLLQRDSKTRLGCGPNDAEEIKQHPFFASIDFEKLYKKSVDPPFHPPVTDITDTNNIDEEFKREKACDSPVPETGIRRSVRFSNFTYVPLGELSSNSLKTTIEGEVAEMEQEQDQDQTLLYDQLDRVRPCPWHHLDHDHDRDYDQLDLVDTSSSSEYLSGFDSSAGCASEGSFQIKEGSARVAGEPRTIVAGLINELVEEVDRDLQVSSTRPTQVQ